MSPLDRKLLRTLWRMKAQAAAIVLVIALGVLILVMMTGLVTTFEDTRQAYYERYRMPDIFAPAVRAPDHVLRSIAALPGVAAAEGRVTGAALITLPGDGRPVQAQALSLPDTERPLVGDIYLTQGRMLRPGHGAEALLLQGFADAHDLRPGDTLAVTMNGVRHRLTVTGLTQSPEMLYSTAPGELVPDDARFAVIWMGAEALRAVFDMKGAFNEAILRLSRDARLPLVLSDVDRLLDPFGGLGAYGVADQTSNRFVTEEIDGLRRSASGVPPIFLGVAAFLLYIMIARMVQSEREQIGILKAFGYTSWEINLHYFKFVLVISVLGAALGCVLGVASGRALSGLYQQHYKFPFLVFRVDPAAFATGGLVSVAAASGGAVMVLRRVFALTPAIAMRPPAPADYSTAGRFGPWAARLLDQPSRMVLRRVLRQPGRMLGAVLGIAAGMALSVGMVSLLAGFDRTLALTFSELDRSDAVISFTSPMSDRVLYDIGRMQGVQAVEPVRMVPAVFRNGLRTYRGAVTGLPPQTHLNRALDRDGHPVPLHTDGVTLSASLAGMLDVTVGDHVQLDVLEGRRPTLQVPVTGVAETLLGSPAYMRLDALNLALREPARISGIYLTADPRSLATLQRSVADMPNVAGISLKHEAEQAMRAIMDEGAGAMRYVMVVVAVVITFGIVYNTARIAFAERARDLASLRVIGFTKSEAAFVLLGELGLVVLVALPLGAVGGYGLSHAISAGFSTDIYQVPVVFSPAGYGTAALAVLAAAALSGGLVRRDVNRVDLVSALKIRE